MPRNGFLNLLKPPGMTSHDVVARVRRRLSLRRVGHLGTLDPAAAGVLPVAAGRAARLLTALGESDKAYRALVILGLATDTLDAEGHVVATADASQVTEAQVRAALVQMTGEIEQIPPAFSAVHVAGRRLHVLARRGRTVAAPSRRVRIDQLDLVEFAPGNPATALLDVACSPGTYVRALAAELGRALGCGAYLGFLLRTRSGRFRLEESATLEEFEQTAVEDILLPPDWPLPDLPRLALDAEAAAFAGGKRVPTGAPPAPRVRVYAGETFLGLGEVLPDGVLQPRLVMVTVDEVRP